jgi:hypothetical protein
LAALALIGIQRVPCLLGAAAESFRPELAAAPPCHAAPDSSAPADSSGESDPCSQCEGVHALVAGGQSGAVLAFGPAVAASAAAFAPARSPRAAQSLDGLARGRAPDRRGIASVRLL